MPFGTCGARTMRTCRRGRRIAAERTGGVIEPGAEAELIVAAAASSGDRQIHARLLDRARRVGLMASCRSCRSAQVG